MVEKDPLIEALAEFAAAPAARSAINEMLRDLSVHAFSTLDVRSAGVHMVAEGKVRSVTALDDVTADLDQVQEREQSGPSVDALRGGEPVTVADLRTVPRRWSGYGRRALELGLVSIAGIPLRLNGETFGALGLYSETAREWSAADLATGQVMAGTTTSCIMGAAALELRSHAIEVQATFDRWVAIEQAKGVIAEERRISIDEAFTVLTRHTRDYKLSLPTVAEAVVNLGLRP